MSSPAARLIESVRTWSARLAALDEAAASEPVDGVWSTRQVVGHLIDSATVNLDRFLRARERDDLDFPGYPQDAWVEAGGYAEVPLAELLPLWSGLNLQVARVMKRTPREARERPRARHSLDRIAWRTVPAGEPTTLEYLMADYVDHFEHHLSRLGLD